MASTMKGLMGEEGPGGAESSDEDWAENGQDVGFEEVDVETKTAEPKVVRASASTAAQFIAAEAAEDAALLSSDSDDDAVFVAPEVIPEEPESLTLPRFVKPPKSATVALATLPKFLHVASDPFDPRTFSEDAEMRRLSEYNKQEFAVDSVIRWKYSASGKNVMSNARIVEWSDGSTQLLVGSSTSLNVSFRRSALRNELLVTPANAPEDEGATCLDSKAVVGARMKFQPTSLSSTAHKALELKIARANIKSKKVQSHTSMIDPEFDQDERVRLHEEQMKRKSMQQKRGASSATRRKRTTLDADFLEGGASGGGGPSVRDIRQRGRQGDLSSSSESENELFKDDDDEQEASASSSSSEDEVVAVAPRKKQKVLEDSDSD